jgi:hypothetical protein
MCVLVFPTIEKDVVIKLIKTRFFVLFENFNSICQKHNFALHFSNIKTRLNFSCFVGDAIRFPSAEGGGTGRGSRKSFRK